MNLYEHQSTVNPNMPLRGLIYNTRLFKGFIASTDDNIYGTKLVRLPRPECIIFYNGFVHQEERKTLRLSDAFYDAGKEKSTGCLEFTATVLNINYGNNKKLMAKCRELEEYALFNNILRGYLRQGLEYEKAVIMAVDECIKQNILHNILIKNKAEVIDLMLTEYNQEQHYKALREEGMEEGIEKGIKKGIKIGRDETEALLKPIIVNLEAEVAELKARLEARELDS